MFGNTLSINVGTVADPELITLKLVNEGNFQSEYRLTESDKLHRVQIRHTTEATKVRGRLMDRHNVMYTQEVFPTELYPEGLILQAYTVSRVPQGQLPSVIVPVANGVSQFTIDNADEIAGWES